MTGMVKEEILTRQMELGDSITNGQIAFDFLLLNRDEFIAPPTEFAYWNVPGQPQTLDLPANSLAYTICQVPIILGASGEPSIEVHGSDGSTRQIPGHLLDAVTSRHIFQRDGMVHHLVVSGSAET
jgi:hypothetical protein